MCAGTPPALRGFVCAGTPPALRGFVGAECRYRVLVLGAVNAVGPSRADAAVRVAEVLAGLDPEQRTVATTIGGPVAVIAGAGTGKTRAITHRIAYAALTGQQNPQAVLALTFTTRAAGELRTRLARLGAAQVQARTFHSAALRQLRYFWPRVYHSDPPELVGGNVGMIAEAAAGEGLHPDGALLRDLAGEISWAKVTNTTLEEYPALARAHGRCVGELPPDAVVAVAQRYERIKGRHGQMDYDDVLLALADLLSGDARVADEVHATYRHFVVDEFQDVSPAQFTLLRLWLGERNDLCVVGDPQQTIHSFAGADPRLLTGFTQAFPGVRVLHLTRNYRSTPQIIAAANTLTTGQPLSQPLQAQRTDGGAVQVTAFRDEQAEASGVGEWLVQRHGFGTPWDELAVLYRVNAQAPALEAVLDDLNVPYTVRDTERLPQRPETRRVAMQELSNQPAVTLCTLHSAKGLEWDDVALIGMHDQMVPFSLANSPEAIAEEQRLCYVGLTRARNQLWISWPRTGSGRGRRKPSRFLSAVMSHSAGARATPGAEPSRPRLRVSRCRVCGQPLTNGTQVKLGRHEDCAVDQDEGLFERLRAWRLRTAQEAGLPAFIVFTDATLRAICEARPADRDQLLGITGVGRHKADRFGDDVLAIIEGNQPDAADRSGDSS